MTSFKSYFANHMEDMIAYKKALGYSESSYKYQLCDLDKYCIENFSNETELSQDIVMSWCCKHNNESINGLNRRLAVIREFGRYLCSIGITAYVMPPKVTAKQTRYVPHIFTDKELSLFFYGADNIDYDYDDKLRPYIIPVIFRMIYCCGLRPGESLKIKNDDLNLESGRLLIKDSKRHKDRVVMLSDDMLQLCNKYVIIRDKIRSFSEYFFSDRYGNAHQMRWLHRYFQKCWQIAGITNFKNPKPRIYDLRHAFATRCLHDWLDKGTDIYTMIPYLSAYMGHSNFSCTAYYIHLIPERLKKSPAIDWQSFENLLPEVSS